MVNGKLVQGSKFKVQLLVLKTSFSPNSHNKTTAVAKAISHANYTSLPHFIGVSRPGFLRVWL